MKPFFINAKLEGKQVSPDDYHAFQRRDGAVRGERDYVMSRSDLMEFHRCPSRWRKGYQSPDSGAKEYGSLIDTVVLDPARMEAKYGVYPETYPDSKTGEPKKWNLNATFCKEYRDAFPGRIWISAEENKESQEALKALNEIESVAELLACSAKQVFLTAEYLDRETGFVIPLKILIDLVPPASSQCFHACLGDFKSTRSAQPDKWAKDAFAYNYDAQGAFYSDIYMAAFPDEDRSNFLFLVQENVAPWEVLTPLPLLSSEFMEIGRFKYRNALRHYCRCLKSGDWPSYAPMRVVIEPFQVLEPPAWAMQQAATASVAMEQPEPQPEDELSDVFH